MLQGAHRLERGMIYYERVRHFYGPDIEQRHRSLTVPGLAPGARRMWASDGGVLAILDHDAAGGR
jgi:hypothetical protein